jgi:transcriptional regulator with XRE-family HTH domain
LIDNADMIFEKVITLKEQSGMTFDEISIKSKIPLTSVKRYFNGETKSPGFLPLSAIIVALDGSVDEVLGLVPQAQKPTNNEFTRQLQSDLWYERKQKRQWVLIFILLVAFDIGLLLFDILNPDMGYIRYVEQASLITQDAFVIMFSMFLK